jgi:hypothetical protein
MANKQNTGFDPATIADYKKRIDSTGRLFMYDDQDEHSDEYAHVYFIGVHEDKEVIFDAVIYTLRLQHESEMFEIAEHRAAQHFPNYKKITYEEDENGNLESLDSEEEEIGLFMAEVIMELEEDDQVKVKEHVDQDLHVDFGIALDVGLHVEEITPEVIEGFIHDFNNDTITLDPSLYSFQTKAEEA